MCPFYRLRGGPPGPFPCRISRARLLFMFIKICGITSVADARMVADCGAQAIGLNFYPASPRFVQPATAREIILSLPPFVEPVGLFVNMAVGEARTLAESLGLRTLQLPGNVTP